MIRNLPRKLKKLIKNKGLRVEYVAMEMSKKENVSISTLRSFLKGVQIKNFEKQKAVETWYNKNKGEK